MDRRTRTAVGIIAIFALAGLGAGSAQATSSAGSVCKSVAVSGVTYKWSAIGNVTCSQAKPWLLKLLGEKGKPDAKLVYKDGPKGFHCSAFADKTGRPTAGSCYTGTIAFPKNGFQWFG